MARLKVDRAASDVSPKVIVMAVAGVVSVVVQVIVSGQLDAAELATALTTLIGVLAAYIKTDSVTP